MPLTDMPPYQYPPQPVSAANAANWQWMQAFYDREVSRPPEADETPDQALRRAAAVRPTPEKLAYLDMELITFPHFGMSTVSGHQQGTGKEDPRLFNPQAFDARQWVQFHQDIGAKMIVFVAKHHDGYALWPTRLNDYCIRSSPWRGGRGDMVAEIAGACREGGLKLGLYISLWDAHDSRCDNPRKGPEHMTPAQREAYQAYVEQQLIETLVPYGEITELWFDGAGTNGAEDWNRIYEIIHRLQPRCLVAMCGFGARWCGNESAVGDVVNWNTLPLLPQLRSHQWVPFHYEQLISKNLPTITDDIQQLRNQELFFIPQEGDTRVLCGGWHWDGRGEPRSLECLIDIYYASIGSGAVLILSPSPDPRGEFNDLQRERLGQWRRWIEDSFSDNLLRGATLTLSGAAEDYDSQDILRTQRDRPWFATQTTDLSLVAEFSQPRTFNNLLVEEHLADGQRIAAFVLDAWQEGRWTSVVQGRTVGHKRILPFSDITAEKVRLRILESRDAPALRFVGLYKALPYRQGKRTYTNADYRPALPDRPGLQRGLAWSFYEDANNGFLPYQEMFSNLPAPNVAPVATGFAAEAIQAFSSVAADRDRTQHFAMRLDGYFNAPARAVYTFKAAATSGCRLYIDRQPAIENDASAGAAATADVPLQAGLHALTVLAYFGSAGKAALSLEVEWPGNAGGDGFGWSSQQRLLPLLCGDGEQGRGVLD
ncbi:MAG: alpha-L-fucosidase [Planctomycetaceae bacterium]|nr:alpha-L-fucosidase [Planctomycetaceae bacterium]